MISEEELWRDWQDVDRYSHPDSYFVNSLSLRKPLSLKRKIPKKVLDIDYVKKREYAALFWMSKQIHYPAIKLMSLLGGIRRGRVHYCLHYQEKKKGDYRIIEEPSPELKKVQRKINRDLLSDILPASNVFGFSGGNVIDAIKPHLESVSWMTIDIKDAFPSILFKHVMKFFRFKGKSKEERLEQLFSGDDQMGYFSYYISYIICELCIPNRTLPQGAPTSPRLFDLVFGQIDRVLNNYADNIKAVYTRYADNIFFSMSDKGFPNRVKWEIVRIIEGEDRKELCLDWHKLKIRNSDSEAIRMLGLNIIKGELHNTRKFKRRFRLLVHHIEWLKQHNMDHDNAYEQLTGILGFAIKDTLPAGLVAQAIRIKDTY